MIRSGVWISGVGAISAAGLDVASTLSGFRDRTRHVTKSFSFETGVKQPAFLVDAELPNPGGQHHGNRTFRLAMHAVNQALDDAGLHSLPAGTRVGVCLGTTVGCQLNSLPFYAAFRRGETPPLDRVHDFLNSNLAQATSKAIRDRCSPLADSQKASPGVDQRSSGTGLRLTVVNACSSGTDAIGVAASWIRAGLCDLAIAGGADEMYVVPLSGFWSLGVMSSEACRPFDRDRSGLNLGEGAGVLILESDVFAKAHRRLHRFAVAGYGSACDAYHLTAPHPQGRGLVAAIDAALRQAGIAAPQIAFVNAHGTATLDNDRTEATVLARLFGPAIKFLSTKGYTGHTLGAAGGLEAVFTVLGLREGWIPASIGFENPADDVPIAPVTRTTAVDGEYALSTSLAFGGNNAAVIIRKTSVAGVL